MIVPHKSNYSKLDFFDYLIPLGKPLSPAKVATATTKAKKIMM
jgi:hypothetical protein